MGAECPLLRNPAGDGAPGPTSREQRHETGFGEGYEKLTCCLHHLSSSKDDGGGVRKTWGLESGGQPGACTQISPLGSGGAARTVG